MTTRRKPTKIIHPKRREEKVRLRLAAQLTRGEIQQLRQRAAADMRSIGSYVAFLVTRHLSGRGNGRRRRKAVARPGDERVSYEVTVPLTPEQKAQLEARAAPRWTSLPNAYV